jgi:hypothetical protein
MEGKMADLEKKKVQVRYEEPGGKMITIRFSDEGEAKDFMAKNPRSFMIKEKRTGSQGGKDACN